MKTNKNTLCRTVSLIAALISLLLCGCANDVDPKLNAKKAQLEKAIAKDMAYLEKTGWNMAERGVGMGMDYMGRHLKPADVENTAYDSRNVYHTTQHLQGLQKELAEVNKEIERQKMIAPNLLADVLAEKHYDTSNPHVFTHMPSTGTMTQTAPMPSASAAGHGH